MENKLEVKSLLEQFEDNKSRCPEIIVKLSRPDWECISLSLLTDQVKLFEQGQAMWVGSFLWKLGREVVFLQVMDARSSLSYFYDPGLYVHCPPFQPHLFPMLVFTVLIKEPNITKQELEGFMLKFYDLYLSDMKARSKPVNNERFPILCFS